MPVALLKFVTGPWEAMRGYLREDLDRIEMELNLPIDLSADVIGVLPTSALPNIPSGTLLGRGSASGVGAAETITLGDGLVMNGRVLQVAFGRAGGGGTSDAGQDGLPGPPGSMGPPGTAGPMGPPGLDAACEDETGFFGSPVFSGTYNGVFLATSKLVSPLVAGSLSAGEQLLFYGTYNASGNTTPFKWAANTDGSFQMALFANGNLAVAGSGATPSSDSLGSGGTFVSAIHNTASGGFQAASNSITTGTDIGYIDFGTFGTASAEKRVGAIHGFLTADATATPTGELRFYTTAAGTISEQIAITSDGRLRFNSTRAKIYSPADSQLTLTSNNEATGFGLQMGTANVMIVANQAQNAYGTVDCLGLKASGVAGASFSGAITNLTVVNGIVTAAS